MEFALLLPVFLMIIFTIVDFGWIALQRGTFLQGCNHISWNITANALEDRDSMNDAPSKITYGIETVAPLVYSDMSERSLLGFDPSRFTVKSAYAELYNKEGSFDVPGRNPDMTVTAINRTRYMDLTAEVSYDIYPMSIVGQMMFGKKITVDQTLYCTRVLGAKCRTE